MNLILFGFKSSGKTYIGKKLAQKLQWDFIDTDDEIEKLYEKKFNEKRTFKKIFKEEGEIFFRALEKEAVQNIKPKNSTIIAVGGGTILDIENQKTLKNLGVLVYLQVDEATLKKRLLENKPLYFAEKDFDLAFKEMIKERSPVYEKIADITVDTSNKNEEEILQELIRIVYGKQ
ncbi:MAG: shikimate kinase [Chlamydiae bacterium]|nr:shikimate kinase [Chlamydiota bacterium]